MRELILSVEGKGEEEKAEGQILFHESSTFIAVKISFEMQPLSSTEKRILLVCYLIGMIGIIQYAVTTFWLMGIYPGGRIGFRESIGYDFTLNFLSDLGRTSLFGRGANPTAFGYMATLTSAGASTIIFFTALSYYFSKVTRSPVAVMCFILGSIAGIGYIGVAINPINEGYWTHVKYVQWGFIGFWLMTLACAYCIFRSPSFPNFYGKMLIIFALILGLQICIMIFGPRSWSSDEALRLQVVAQKAVVYSEIIAMALLAYGAMRALNRSSIQSAI